MRGLRQRRSVAVFRPAMMSGQNIFLKKSRRRFLVSLISE
jgi:hypothetical protein